MNQGAVEQFGTPEEIYNQPATRYVARFIGSPRIELYAGTLERGTCRIGGVALPIAAMSGGDPEVEIGVRPEHVRLGERGFPATVRLVQPVGPATHVTLDWEGGSLTASLPGFVRLAPGSAVKVEIDPDHLLVFDRKSGKRRAPQRQS
jgi:ABC-type sugar transport system ATPase subunit